VIERSEEVKKQTLKYAMFKVSAGQVVVDRTSNDSDWKSFLNDLPESEPRFATYSMHLEIEGKTRYIQNCLSFVPKWQTHKLEQQDRLHLLGSRNIFGSGK